MKYVRLKHPSKSDIYRLGLMATHAQIVAEVLALNHDYVPFSAGFVKVAPTGRLETFGQSTSLTLSPHADDARIMSALHHHALSEGGRPSRSPFSNIEPDITKQP